MFSHTKEEPWIISSTQVDTLPSSLESYNTNDLFRRLASLTAALDTLTARVPYFSHFFSSLSSLFLFLYAF